MSSPKEKIGLKAIAVNFTPQSIVYKVEFVTDSSIVGYGIVFSPSNIKNKDLILKPTFLDQEMEVVYAPVNVTPHFYQSILDGTIRNISEYEVEREHIYNVGDIVGYIFT